jgi:hypothetical protein
MGWKTFAIVFAAAAVALTGVPAEAAKKKGRHATVYGESRDLPGVRRQYVTRITVTRRSYLDAGTEVTPGTRKFTDYIYVLETWNPSSLNSEWSSTDLNRYGRSPLPGAYFPWP